MAIESALHERRRPLTDGELLAIPWMRLLTEDERERAATDLKVADASPGETLCRTGKPVTYWFGVIDGLLKMSTDNAQGQTITYTRRLVWRRHRPETRSLPLQHPDAA